VISQHVVTFAYFTSRMDDPLIWGILPLANMFDPQSLRWGLGAHDICYKNR
jgi:monolysocardiolipin acyltransferase